jgi:DNA-binding CsgD family transcriptional regulator
MALTDHGLPFEALDELAVADERFARRPGWITGLAMSGARAYVLASIDDDEAAAIAAERCITASQDVGVGFTAGLGVLLLAAVERRRGDFDAVAATLNRADDSIAKGVRGCVPDLTLERARLCRAAGLPDRAEEHAHVALVTALDMGFRRTTVLVLEELAHVSTSAGSAPEGARLLGACRTARQEMRLVPTREEQRWINDTVSAISALLGDEAGEILRAGEALSLDDAAAYARRARGERGRPAAGWGSLTPTERQVVDLVVEGLANPQIADRLLMSRGTVKAHLAHVYRKTGVANRAELAAMAARQSRSVTD